MTRTDIRTDARGQYRVTMHPADAPKSMWAGLVIGLAGFLLHITTSMESTLGGTYECSSTDYAPFLIAALCLLFGIPALVRTLRGTDRVRMNPGVVYGVTALVLVLGVVHLVRGFMLIDALC